MKKFFGLMLMVLMAAMIQVMAQDDEDLDQPHYGYIQKYEGSKTCLKCHMKEGKDVFHSVHYQWQTKVSNVLGFAKGSEHGKMTDLNDFCTNPRASRVGWVKAKDGKIVVEGCGKCHVGDGLLPSETISEKQLDNIDCLMCHAPGYSRKLVEKNGRRVWIPKDGPELLTIRARNVRKPTAQMCLRCHAGAGGGTNFKRGDLESAHYEADDNIDVHFANDMACVDCHTTKDHHIAGQGADLLSNDLPGVKVACENCHENAPHDSAVLNRHARTVYCTACHIPDFARVDATDMYRDWRTLTMNEAGTKYEEKHIMEKHVKPVYGWWNGAITAQDPMKPVSEVFGLVHMTQPVGSINDPNSRIYAFKRHVAILPMLKKTKELIPVAVTIAFQTGDIDKAVIAGAKSYRNITITKDEYTWVKVDRYMGLFHEVLPGAKALKCNVCHGKKATRFDWKALGYKGDPRKFGGRFSAKKK